MENLIQIPLDLPETKIIEQYTDDEGNIIIEVESTKEGCNCNNCKRHITVKHSVERVKRLRHTSVFGKKTFIEIKPKRYSCPYCQEKLGKQVTTTQPLSWHIPRSPNTIDYETHILTQLINSTVSDVAIKEGLSHDLVQGIIDRYIIKKPNWEEIEKLGVIGIDDLSQRKGHKDRLAIISYRDDELKLHVIGILKDYKKKTVKDFFLSIPKKLRKTVTFVCCDLYDGFINAAKEVFGRSTKIVADRFHIAKLYREVVDNVRKEELKILKKELNEKEYKKLRRDSMLVRHNDLSTEQAEKLESVFKLIPKLKIVWELSQNLTNVFNQHLTVEQAWREIIAWKNRVKKSGLSCFETFFKTLTKCKNIILNYFLERQSSGFVEGLNNKLRVIKRRCYGLLNPVKLFQRLTLDLEGYNGVNKFINNQPIA